MATEFEKAIGWKGPHLSTLINRDISIVEEGELKRGPIQNTHVEITPELKTTAIQFRVGWIGVQENDEWRLESGAINPEGISLFTMNLDIVPLVKNAKNGEIYLRSKNGTVTIHQKGDNIPKPDAPMNKKISYSI